MSDWRDTTSPDWVIGWGVVDEERWLEDRIAMHKGSYEQRPLSTSLPFIEPLYGETKYLAVYDWTHRATGVTRRIVCSEITPGIYAYGYWKGAL